MSRASGAGAYVHSAGTAAVPRFRSSSPTGGMVLPGSSVSGPSLERVDQAAAVDRPGEVGDDATNLLDPSTPGAVGAGDPDRRHPRSLRTQGERDSGDARRPREHGQR